MADNDLVSLAELIVEGVCSVYDRATRDGAIVDELFAAYERAAREDERAGRPVRGYHFEHEEDGTFTGYRLGASEGHAGPKGQPFWRGATALV
jgi:hypothetical protein